ncbi:MAG: hypothetical protein ACAH82_17140, partial [Solirubrobacteraceae bacterium]
HRAMIVILDALAALGPADYDATGRLDRQLRAWAAARPGTPDVPAAVLWLCVMTWSRLHGLGRAGAARDLRADGDRPRAAVRARGRDAARRGRRLTRAPQRTTPTQHGCEVGLLVLR